MERKQKKKPTKADRSYKMPPFGDEQLQILLVGLANLNLEQHRDLYPHSINSSNNNGQGEKEEKYFIGKYKNCNLKEAEEDSSSFSPLDVLMDKFICDSLLTQENYSTCMKMLEELQKVLNFGTIKPFGSFFMGLANSDSDVDVSFDISDQISSADLFDKVLKVLQNAKVADGQYYIRLIQPYKNIRVPFIRFMPNNNFSISQYFNISCDLSFKNTLGVENSRLILFLFSLNPVMRPLTILVKKWAQSYGLNKTNGLKGYTIALLVIIFMVRKKNLLSIHRLQSLVPPKIVNGGWNVAFCTDVHLIQKKMEKMGIKSPTLNHPRELLPFMLEFFDMLTNLPSNSVMCTLTGGFIKKDYFKPGNEDRLPPSQAQFIQMRKKTEIRYEEFFSKRLCLQDPFDLAYNVMKFVYTFPKIQEAIKETVGRLHGNFLETYPFTSLFIPTNELGCFSFEIEPQPSFFELSLSSMSISDLYELWYDLALEFLNTRLITCFDSFDHSEPKKETTTSQNKQKFSITFQLSIPQTSKYFTQVMNVNADKQQQSGPIKTTKKTVKHPPMFKFSFRCEYENDEDEQVTEITVRVCSIALQTETLTQMAMSNDNSTMNAVRNAMRKVINRRLGEFVVEKCSSSHPQK